MRRGTKSHKIFKDRAINRADDLLGMFMDLQSARKERRNIDMAVLEEQVHQMLKEWKKELNQPSPAPSLHQGASLGSFSPDITRLLQLYDEEDDATNGLAAPKPDQDSYNATQNATFHKMRQEQGVDTCFGINTTGVHNPGVDTQFDYISCDLPREFEQNCNDEVYGLWGEDGLPQITGYLANIWWVVVAGGSDGGGR
ncbi:hypothetical protein L2E82_51909 [Cichorium intybus]|nr:hypothetical protein L2E82_51909 [Cichorium intybus]